MLKPVFQLIGLVVVIAILLLAVLFYLDGKGLLTGELADFIGSLRALFEQIKSVVTSFVHESGIADDAADLLDEGADMLRGATPSPAQDGAPRRRTCRRRRHAGAVNASVRCRRPPQRAAFCFCRTRGARPLRRVGRV